MVMGVLEKIFCQNTKTKSAASRVKRNLSDGFLLVSCFSK